MSHATHEKKLRIILERLDKAEESLTKALTILDIENDNKPKTD